MCFSTVASFGAGVLLTGVGVVAVRKTDRPAQIPFALIPAIFAIQQFSEGFVWLSLSNEAFSAWHRPATYLFLIFAQVVWPVWIPLAMMLLEKDRWRRQILYTLLGLGLLLSAQTIYCLTFYSVDSRIAAYHIQYALDFPPTWMVILAITYGIVTVFSTFLSTVRWMWVLGIPIALSYLVTRILFADYVLSVWCFFAAIISVAVVYVLAGMRKT